MHSRCIVLAFCLVDNKCYNEMSLYLSLMSLNQTTKNLKKVKLKPDKA